jgi:hypothetical protein
MESALKAATDTDSVFDAWWDKFGRYQLDTNFACKMAFLHGQAFGQELMAKSVLNRMQADNAEALTFLNVDKVEGVKGAA